MFVIARFLLGFGIPFAIVAASSMIGELSYPKERARIGSLFNASWFIGMVISPLPLLTHPNAVMPICRCDRSCGCYSRDVCDEVYLGLAYSFLLASFAQSAPSHLHLVFARVTPVCN